MLTACSLLILEYNLKIYPEEQSSRPRTPNTPSTPRSPNGLLHQFPTRTEGDDELARATMRDMAAVVAVVCMLVSLFFESFKSWQWTYRDPLEPINPENPPKKVKVLESEWNLNDDFYAIIIECAKAALLLLMVCPTFLYLQEAYAASPPTRFNATGHNCYTPSIVCRPNNGCGSLYIPTLRLAKIPLHSMPSPLFPIRWLHCIRRYFAHDISSTFCPLDTSRIFC
jgi:hypothetical protein